MIKTAAYLTSFSSRSDGSASVRFATQELSGEDFAKLQEHQNLYGWLVFADSASEEPEVPQEKVEPEGKSQSRRIRGVLYVLWEQTDTDKDFEQFYREKTESIISQIKDKLD